MRILRETSERSRNKNKAEKKIHEFKDFVQIEFEGFTVKENKLTGLFDRICISEGDVEELNEELILKILMLSESNLEYKKNISNKARVNWYFVFYQYRDQKNLIYDITNNSIEKRFNDFKELGEWLLDFSDQIKLSRYEESGLPNIDKIMRENELPWPGNLDGLLINKNTNEIVSIIEYQNTSKKPVKEHDNNDFMHSTPYRKGDSRRWMVIKTIAETLESKIIVIVWSNNEDLLAIKNIESFTLDQLKNVSKID